MDLCLSPCVPNRPHKSCQWERVKNAEKTKYAREIVHFRVQLCPTTYGKRFRDLKHSRLIQKLPFFSALLGKIYWNSKPWIVYSNQSIPITETDFMPKWILTCWTFLFFDIKSSLGAENGRSHYIRKRSHSSPFVPNRSHSSPIGSVWGHDGSVGDELGAKGSFCKWFFAYLRPSLQSHMMWNWEQMYK